MRPIAILLLLAAGCEKKAPRYDGPLRVEFGDCAAEPAWVSGPRPAPLTEKVATAEAKPAPTKPAVEIDRQKAIEAAREAGVIGTQQGGAFASLTGTGDISSGFDDANIYGGLLGDDGKGGGTGTGWGTIGTGRYGTIGHGAGTGYGIGGRRSTNGPTVSIGQPNAQGDLDKAIIRRYIKRNINKIQYCYEKQLLSDPKLEGTIATQFFIDPEGHVASSSASGLHPDVAKCVAGVIKGIEFPKPKGGGGVQVNYPFTFRSAGTTNGGTFNTGGRVDPPASPVSVAVGPGTGDPGPHTMEELDRVIKARSGIYRACFQKELARTPGISGSIVVKFEIDGEGRVSGASANTQASTLDNDAVRTCMVSNVIRLRFPPRGGTASVTYPFTFSATGGAAAPDQAGSGAPAPDAKPDPKPVDPPDKVVPPTDPYRPGTNNPLVAQSVAIEDCLRGDPKHYGVVVVALDTGKVEGVSDDVAECIGKIATALPKPATPKRCSLAFGSMPIEELPSIEVTASSINVDGTPVSTVAAVLEGNAPTFKIEPLFAKLDGIVKAQTKAAGPVAIEGPRVIRAAAATPIRVFNKVLATTLAAASDFVLATDKSGAWKLVDPWMFPAVPVPRGTGRTWSHGSRAPSNTVDDSERVVLSVLISKERMWIGISRVNEFYEVPNRPTGYDFDKLATHLKDLKRSAFFVDRTDLEIAGEDGTYGDLVHAIEVAHDIGFSDQRVTMPEGLSARPTL